MFMDEVYMYFKYILLFSLKSKPVFRDKFNANFNQMLVTFLTATDFAS